MISTTRCPFPLLRLALRPKEPTGYFSIINRDRFDLELRLSAGVVIAVIGVRLQGSQRLSDLLKLVASCGVLCHRYDVGLLFWWAQRAVQLSS